MFINFCLFFWMKMSNTENVDDAGAAAEDGRGSIRRKVNFIIDMLNIK